jgi:hypothetical protein
MPTTVYVVTAGRWSDYGIAAIFSDEETATAYADRVSRLNQSAYRSGPYARVEAWTLDEHVSAVRRDTVAFSVVFDDDGSAHAEGDASAEVDEAFGPDPRVYGSPMTCRTMQRDEETAIKVCAERRAAYLAEREGVLA